MLNEDIIEYINLEKKVIFDVKPELPYSIEEALNRLRINIGFLGTDIRLIMVASSEPNEGKSFVSMNLWKQMAMAGEHSLLLDLDLRNSVMVNKYRMHLEKKEKLMGTSDFLAGDERIENAIYRTEMEKGDILPNVNNLVNPSMLLEGKKLPAMLKYMAANYRYVFIDVPPLAIVSDGERIASMCDGVVLTVRGGVTSRHLVRRTIQQLERSGCPLLGIVLNRVGGAGTGYYSKYYGSKYYGSKYYGSKYYGGSVYGEGNNKRK